LNRKEIENMASKAINEVQNGEKVKPIILHDKEAGQDYTLEFKDADDNPIAPPTEPGSYSMRATAIEGGGYQGSTAWVPFTIVTPNDIGGTAWEHYFWPSESVDLKETTEMPTSVLYSPAEPDDDEPTRLVLGTDYRLARIEDEQGELVTTGTLPMEPGCYVA
jgi:hypothetical protein